MEDRNGLIIEDHVVIGYTGTAAEIHIPAGITRIGDRAFAECKDLGELVFDGGELISVGKYSFYRCRSEHSICLPDSVQSIEEGAFMECDAEVNNIPYKVISLGRAAFLRCRRIRYGNFPKGLKEIPAEAFAECNFRTDCIYLTDGLERIGEKAFKGCSNAAILRIPDTVTSIGGSAFEDCAAVPKVRLPRKLTYLGEHAFRNCTHLKEFDIPQGLNDLQYQDLEFNNTERIRYTGEGATQEVFCDNGKIRYCPRDTDHVRLPDDTEELAPGFHKRKKLEVIEFGSPIEQVGKEAFAGCSGLREIRGLRCRSVLGDAFRGCQSLRELRFGPGLTCLYRDALKWLYRLERLYLPSSFHQWAWEGMEYLLSLKAIVSEEVCDAGLLARFLGVDFLDPKGEPLPYHPKTTRADWHFAPDPENGGVCLTGAKNIRCTGENDPAVCLILPEEHNGLPVTSIGPDAFCNLKNVNAVSIPDSVVSIGAHAFAEMSDLQFIHIPKSLKSVAPSAFIKTKMNVTQLTALAKRLDYIPEDDIFMRFTEREWDDKKPGVVDLKVFCIFDEETARNLTQAMNIKDPEEFARLPLKLRMTAEAVKKEVDGHNRVRIKLVMKSPKLVRIPLKIPEYHPSIKEREIAAVLNDPYIRKEPEADSCLTAEVWKDLASMTDRERAARLFHYFRIEKIKKTGERFRIRITADDDSCEFTVCNSAETFRGFIRQSGSLKDGETMEAVWPGDHDRSFVWNIERRRGILYVKAPGIREPFFIPRGNFFRGTSRL